MKIDFLYYEECPSHEPALERLLQVVADEGVTAELAITKVESEEQAQRLHFTGSPTIRVDGQDIDPPPPDSQYALTCRAFRRADGRISPLPPEETIRRALQ